LAEEWPALNALNIESKYGEIDKLNRSTNRKLGHKGYPSGDKPSQVEPSWPYKPGTKEYLDSAFWVPGDESQKRRDELRRVFG
jgi:hypothetical protein